MPLKYRKKILAQKLSIRATIQEERGPHGNIVEQAVSLRLKAQSKEDFVKELNHFVRFSEQINSEGLVLKNSSSLYSLKGTRSNEWAKLKQGLF